MIVIDERLLAYFRSKGKCEVCGTEGQMQPHHCKPRGMSGGSRLDVALNLIALCWQCHGRLQEGGRAAQEQCWRVIALREGLKSWEQCEEAVHRLLRRPKA